MSRLPLWTLALLSLVYLLQTTAALRISAFNIKSFGDSKMSNETIAGVIRDVSIVLMYDVALIQEVRDSDLSAVRKLMNQLNRALLQPYSYVVSEPLGRGSYKEQYLFIYRTGMVSVVDNYQYKDGCEPCGNDTFSREPFIVKFSSPHTEVQEFVLVPLHTPPSEAVAEINALYDVYLDVTRKWKTDNILFLGDFNADCDYVRPQDWPSIRLRTSPAFQWLIPDSADSTVSSNTDCAYDRIVVCGSELRRSTVAGSATVNNFQEVFNLSREDVSEADKLPVFSVLQAAANCWPGDYHRGSWARDQGQK
uniref:Deoxyribonuclease n=1 Tax=Pelusios castaneus TaxID=367368 RepID=A0A8C8SQV3_9SAUR